mgnify:CR=1 FL=1
MKKKTLGIIIVSVLGAAAIFCSAMFTHQYDPGYTGLVNIGNAIIAVRFIKAALQIEVRLVRGLHNGVLCVESLRRNRMED